MMDKKIKSVLHEALDGEYKQGDFDRLWDRHEYIQNKQINKRRIRPKKLIMILAATFILMISGIVSAQYMTYNFQRDDTTYVFEMDEEVLGTWKVVDCIKEEKDFIPGTPNPLGEAYLEQLEFHKNGDLSIVANIEGKTGIPRSGIWVWTKNHIISEEKKVNNQYTIKKIGGEVYLFSQWKDDTYRWGIVQQPDIYVFRRIEDAKITEKAPEPVVIREDDVTQPFVDNEEMKGTWKSITAVNQIEHFKGKDDVMYPELYLLELGIQDDGKVTGKLSRGSFSSGLRWTGDTIINEGDKTASKCTIKKIKGETYMFYEWKSGDYIIGGEDPGYYVLIKQ